MQKARDSSMTASRPWSAGSPFTGANRLDRLALRCETGRMKIFSLDLTRLPSSGHGTVRIPTNGVVVGDTIGVHDEDTDTFEAAVIAVEPGQAEIQVRWARTLSRA